jgi:hypothetical protein
MKTRRSIYTFFSFVALALVTTHCSNEDDAVRYSLSDVSSRISGFSSPITGAGASLTVNGEQLDGVVRIAFGNLVVPAKSFTSMSESSITFPVPSAAGIGDTPVLLVWPGSERASSVIKVVPLQVVSSYAPVAGSEGETVTIQGSNLDIVETVKIGTAVAAITEKASNRIKFTIPAGAASAPVTLVSPAGTVNTVTQFTSCGADANSIDCKNALNLNFSFELGTDDNFTNWNKFNGGTKIVATTNVNGGEVFRGARALRVIRDGTITPGDQWRIQLASDFVPTDNGASYTVYAWVKASVAGATFRFSNADAAQYGGDTQIPTTWTRISWSFTSNAAQKRIVMDLNGAAQTVFFIDDVKLVKN